MEEFRDNAEVAAKVALGPLRHALAALRIVLAPDKSEVGYGDCIPMLSGRTWAASCWGP